MKIFKHLSQVENTPEEAKLDVFSNQVYAIFRAYDNSFKVANQLVDLERENYIRDTEIKTAQKLTEVNRIYRVDFLNVSADYKRENLTVWSYAGKMLVDIIGETFNFNFNKRNYKTRAKLICTPSKFHDACIIALAFLFAKYKTVYKFHIYATMVKLAVEYFEYESMSKCDIHSEYMQLLETDVEVIFSKISELNLSAPHIKVKQAKPKKDKVEFPPKHYFEAWLKSGKYTVTELKTIIAKQYNVSTKTVQRKLAEYGLTRKYSKKI